MNWLETLYTDGSRHFVSNPYPAIGDKVELILRVKKNNDIKAVLLRRVKNGEEHNDRMRKLEPGEKVFAKLPKELFEENDYYIGELKINEPLVNYHFTIACEKNIFFFNQFETTSYPPKEYYDYKIVADYKPADWVHRTVFYQIFADRFFNGDESNDVQDNEYSFDGYYTKKMKWNEAPLEWDEVHNLDFYGGDLQGIEQKIEYLKSIGVNGIYVNPIFHAATSHKFDCLDYFNVDPHFGGNKALSNLTKALHKNDMRLMVDVSINHTGIAHRWFNKEGVFFDKSEGAYGNKDSKERKYYFFDEDKGYKAWQGVETLPVLNYTSDELREIIFGGEDSLVKHWLKEPYNIDAWRFDVANEMARYDDVQLSREILTLIRKSIKDAKSDAYIIGEEWTDATEHLQGDQWDSAMNYLGFARPVRQFVGDEELYYGRREELRGILPYMSAYELSMRVKTHLASIPHQLQLMQFNLIDSHDVYRMHNNPDIGFDEVKAAAVMMFTFPGTPNVYYGDEVGLDGRIGTFEGCRYPMEWNEKKQDKKVKNLHAKLGMLKQTDEVLHDGGFKIILTEGKVFSYARFNHKSALVGVVSMEDERKEVRLPIDRIPVKLSDLDGSVVDEFGRDIPLKLDNDGNLIVILEPKETVLFRIK